jgi:hypothetical protein
LMPLGSPLSMLANPITSPESVKMPGLRTI